MISILVSLHTVPDIASLDERGMLLLKSTSSAKQNGKTLFSLFQWSLNTLGTKMIY
jgi:hypothetical protein